MNDPKPHDVESQPDPSLDEADVAAYLRANPSFLERHPEVLEHLRVSHESGSAVSLIERQVASLQRQNADLKRQLDALVSTARENELRVQHLNRLARVLIRSEEPEGMIAGLRECLHEELGVDELFVGLLGRPSEDTPSVTAINEDDERARAVTNVFRRGKPICGPLNDEQIDVLFPEHGGTPPQSAALVPLGTDEVHGVLVLGSRDPQRFEPDMGTMFLELLGDLVTTALRRHLGPERL